MRISWLKHTKAGWQWVHLHLRRRLPASTSHLEVGDSAALESVLEPVDIGGDGGVSQVAVHQRTRQGGSIGGVEGVQPERQQARRHYHQQDKHHLDVHIER